MKRLIVLLIVLAGGLAAAAFAVPSNAATVNGVSIGQSQFTSDLNAIAGSTDYQCFLNAEEAVDTGGEGTSPPVDGAGSGSHATVTAAFAASYLDTEISHQLVSDLAVSRHLHITSADLTTARQELTTQTNGILEEVVGSKYACGSTTAKEILDSMPSSFVDRNVRFDAIVSVLEEDEAGVGSSTADFERYYENHAAEFDKACFTAAEYASQAAAQTAASAIAAGTPFATEAAAAEGAPHECVSQYELVASLPSGSGLASLPLNTVSSPIADGSTYLLFEITSRTPTSYTQARTDVLSAVQNAGASKAETLIEAVTKKADVTVDPRYGAWKGTEIVAPVGPPALDVLNQSVNGSGT